VRSILTAYLTVLLACSIAIAQPPLAQFAEPWQQPYVGEDVTGDHVIALWSFDEGTEQTDAAGKDLGLEFDGVQISPDGRFGSCLESSAGASADEATHHARTEHRPELSPAGPFTIEMWIKPKAELNADYGEAFLIDKKFTSNTDYRLSLSSPARDGRRTLRAILGYGFDSATYTSEPAEYESGVWYHVAFSYDGKGTGYFFRDGLTLGNTNHMGRGPITAGRRPLYIGDRSDNKSYGFPGFIDQVRISDKALEFRPVILTFSNDRTAFVRMEQAPPLEFTVTNLQRTPLRGATCRFAIADAGHTQVQLPELSPGQEYTVQYAFDTSLRPRTYRIHSRIEIDGEDRYVSDDRVEVVLVGRPLPLRMPVVLWGGDEIEKVKNIGFTHMIGISADYTRIWQAGEPTTPSGDTQVVAAKQRLNEALAKDMRYISSLSPGAWIRRTQDEFKRVDRHGEPLNDVNGLYPEAQEFCYNVGASMAQAYGAFPAFAGALVHTEVRDHANLSFSEIDHKTFREYAGYDIPELAENRRGVLYSSIADFPPDRIIPDDYPLYVYYRWYWKHGDGWNDLHSALHNGLKSATHPDFWTFHDPACRAAKIWGSGGDVDYLSHWTTSYPDPLKVGTPTDELLAMATGGPDYQKVMKMTQIISGRRGTAPMRDDPAKLKDLLFGVEDGNADATDEAGTDSYRAAWEKELALAASYLTIAPMHLREAFWTKMARPIQGIMYHGWQCLVETGSHGSYRHTHPDTRDELRRLVRTVVEPLGPTLMQIPERPTQVAFLESFAAEIFARRGGYGRQVGWTGDASLIMQYAQLQPQVVYDETILRDGLDQYQVLVMVDCDVLTASVAERVKAFQTRGGIIIADENLTPAIKPDILLHSHKRPKKADQARALLLQKAAELRTELDAHFTRYGQSDNPNVITRFRQWGSTDYVFTINDLREYGDYFGHHGLVMENGLPSDATITVNRPAGYIYDLVGRRQLHAQSEREQLLIPVALGPCEGRVLMITERPISQLNITGADSVARGGKLSLTLTVADDAGQAVDAVIPVHVEIQDAASQVAEFTGYYGAADGQMQIELDIASNDVPGMWTVHATELASGREAAKYFRVTR
jgi:hypothetical protein